MMLADILQQLPDQVINEVLLAMGETRIDSAWRPSFSILKTLLEGLLNTDTITVRRSHTLDVVLRYLRRHDEIPSMTDNLLVG